MAWHPHHENLLTTGGFDGTILYWLVGQGGEGPAAEVRGGHESAIWSLAWHPAGHIMCSGSNDNTSKFWCRNRPGEVPRDTTQRSGPAAMAEQALAASMMNASDARVISGGGSGSTGGNRRGKTGRRRAGNRPRRQSRRRRPRRRRGGHPRQHRRREDHRRPRRRRARRGDRRGGRGGPAGASEPSPSPPPPGRPSRRGRRGAAGPRAGGGAKRKADPRVVRGRSVRTRAGRDVNDAGWDWEPTIERLSSGGNRSVGSVGCADGNLAAPWV